MATFAISLSIEIEANDYDDAYEIQSDIFRKLEEHPEVTGGPYEIDVEQTDGFEDSEYSEEDEE